MFRRLPPLNALRAFESAARLGSFVRAADELAVTPTAVSHQIKGLEEVLGIELFIRMPRSLRLTAAGAAFLPELTRGFDMLARASARLSENEIGGLLHVSTTSSFANCWLVPRLDAFHRRYPELTVRITTTARQVDFIHEGVDIAIRYGKGVYPGLRSVKLLEEEVFPVASPALLNGEPPLREWSDLEHHVLLHDFTGDLVVPWMSWALWLRRMGVDEGLALRGSLEFDNSEMLVQAAVRGHGVALGRTVLVAEHLREGRLVTLFDVRYPADFAYFAVAPEATAEQARVRVFTEWLIEEAARDVAAGLG